MLLYFHNVLYGTILDNLIYYCKFAKSLAHIGFEINQYHPCVANKMMNGSQMTIIFHLDNCKMSHRERKDNYCMIKCIHQGYEIIFDNRPGEMSVSRGKVHEYLGITLYYAVCG